MAPIESWFSDALEECAFQKNYPLYAHILSQLRLIDSKDVNVMAVSGNRGQPVLHINRAFFRDSTEYLPGVLLHEIHHVVLGHLSDPRFRTADNRRAMTVAMELSANEDIREPLPGDPYRIERFSDVGIAPGQSTWERYQLLASAMPQESGDLFGSMLDEAGCAALTKTKPDEAAPSPGAVDTAIVAELLAAIDADDRGKQSKTRIAGRKPGDILDDLAVMTPNHAAKLNWKVLLRQFAGARARRAFNYARPNRRQRERIGQVPGKSRRIDNRKKLMVVIDTSASMDRETVREIFVELEHITTHADVTVVECDAAIQRVYAAATFSGEIRGRGGTDLRPPFEPDFLRRHRPGGIIYFTDGNGPFPAKKPIVPTLWVLSEHRRFACPWGRQVRM